MRPPRADDEPSTYEHGNDDYDTYSRHWQKKQRNAMARERKVFATLRLLLPSQVAELPWASEAHGEANQTATLTDVAQFLRMYNSSRTEIISAAQLWMNDFSRDGFRRACQRND